MSHSIHPYIMCGGSGTRLWPMSTTEKPKQFHKIVSNLTMLQETAARGQQSGRENILPPSFVCSTPHKDLVISQCRELEIEPHSIILEPLARNTAAVAATISLNILNGLDGESPEPLILLLPADHHIEKVEEFWQEIERGVESALSGNIVTFGIQPTRPETGYGYIHAGEAQSDGSTEIVEFVEKPDLETAKRYLNEGNFYWNAGIFLFKPDTMKAAFEKHASDILSAVTRAIDSGSNRDSVLSLDPGEFAKCRSQSFDYAIMEQADNISLVGPIDIGWSDIGSWQAVSDFQAANAAHLEDQTYDELRKYCSISSHNVLTRSSGPLITTLGVSNIAVIATEKSVLVIDLESSQEVKKIVETLRKNGATEYL